MALRAKVFRGLDDPHDETLFEHYTRSQLVEVGLDGQITDLE